MLLQICVWYQYPVPVLLIFRAGWVRFLKMDPNPLLSIHFKIVTIFASRTRNGSVLTKIITSLLYSLSHRSAGYDRGVVFLPILTQSLISFRDKVQYSTVLSLLSFLLSSPLFPLRFMIFISYVVDPVTDSETGSGFRKSNTGMATGKERGCSFWRAEGFSYV